MHWVQRKVEVIRTLGEKKGLGHTGIGCQERLRSFGKGLGHTDIGCQERLFGHWVLNSLRSYGLVVTRKFRPYGHKVPIMLR